VFLVPFVSGWLVPGALGALYGLARRGRPGRGGMWMMALGVVPSALAFPPGSPPVWWLPYAGRLGLAAVGAGAGALALGLVWRVYAGRREGRRGAGRSRWSAVWPAGAGAAHLAGIAVGALVLKSVIDLAVAAGPALQLIHSHSMAVAYLHLALLGGVTAGVAAALLRAAAVTVSVAAAVVFGLGLILMVGPLAVMGWPGALNVSLGLGAGIGTLLALSLAGGALLVAGVLPIAMALGTIAPAEGMVEPMARPGTPAAGIAAPPSSFVRQGSL
jgi:hypothetical protein